MILLEKVAIRAVSGGQVSDDPVVDALRRFFLVPVNWRDIGRGGPKGASEAGGMTLSPEMFSFNGAVNLADPA